MDIHAQTREQAMELITKDYFEIKDWIAEHGTYDDGENAKTPLFSLRTEITILDVAIANEEPFVEGKIKLNAGSFCLYAERFDVIAGLRAFIKSRDTVFQSFTLEAVNGYFGVTLLADVSYDAKAGGKA